MASVECITTINLAEKTTISSSEAITILSDVIIALSEAETACDEAVIPSKATTAANPMIAAPEATASIKTTDTPSESTCPSSEATTALSEATTIVAQKTHSISIENLFKQPCGNLKVEISEVKDFNIGSFKVTGVISDDGAHGLVVSCIDSDNAKYAMKIERGKHEMDADAIAFSEISAHTTIQNTQDLRIPRLHKVFKERSKEIVVMEQLGPDLSTLWGSMGYRDMSLKTTLQIGISLLTAYEQMHQTGWLHLTSKPINFCIGGTAETCHKIYAIDFGRAQKYLVTDAEGNTSHRAWKRHHESPQNSTFQSIWGELDITTSRRDDIMSLSFTLLYLSGVDAPWKGTGLSKQKWIKSLSLELERSRVRPFEDILIYASRMKYTQTPDYERLRRNLRHCAERKGFELDGKFDWDDRIYFDENGRIVLKEAPEKGEDEDKEKKRRKRINSKTNSKQRRAREKRRRRWKKRKQEKAEQEGKALLESRLARIAETKAAQEAQKAKEEPAAEEADISQVKISVQDSVETNALPEVEDVKAVQGTGIC